VEDPETGGTALGSGGSESTRARSGARGRRRGRRSESAVAKPPAVLLGQADGIPDNAQRTRKRRKRKRGRKVFAPGGLRVDSAPQSQNTSAKPDADGAVNGAGPDRHHLRQHRLPDATNSSRDLPVFAALDLGTNNCRLLVAIPTRPGQFRVIDAYSRIVRLGEGLSANGRLGAAAMDRAIEALKVCGEKLGNRTIRRARLVATEACRSAENGREFLNRVKDEAGIELEIIDRRTEARLAVSGCGSLVERETDAVVLFDIGGGSSEIALIDLSRHRSPRLANHIVSWTSLPVGVVSLAEHYGGREITRETFAAMVAHVREMIESFDGRHRLSHLMKGSRFHLLGTSGTVTTLAGIHLGLERYDRRRVDGLWMDNDNVDRMIETLIGWDFGQRVANPCIGADRADLVLAGCAILEAIRAQWPSPRLRVADRGLREGILSELMADEGVWRRSVPAGGRP
jgi:exopolyphosphatase / guanosine-5'-triphosphate,3'-diphosphate pyrophosphatase